MSDHWVQVLQTTGLYEETYGPGQMTAAEARDYGRALLAIAGADGEVSAREREWLLDLGRSLGLPDHVLDDYQDFDHRQANLPALLRSLSDHSSRQFRRMLVYDAIRMARADGVYAEREREAVRRAAEWLQVGPEVLQILEGVVELEEAARKMRRSLFA